LFNPCEPSRHKVDEKSFFAYASGIVQIETLKIFCDLAETKSFTRTAERHGVTQSAISQQLAAMEREINTVLVLRSRKTFQLTPAGEICHQRCLEIVRLTMEMGKRLQQAKDASAGAIELAACFSIGLHQLPPVLDRFRRDFPAVEVRVRYGHIDRVHELVMENEVDLGLVAYPRRLPGLAIDRFRHERLMLVCHPQHPLAARPAVRVRDLKEQKFVAWKEIRFSPFFKGIPQNLRHFFQPFHEFNEVEMVKRMVEMDGGIAILPEALVREEVASRRLAAVPFEGGGFTEPLAVIYRQSRTLSPAMENFIKALKQPDTDIPSPLPVGGERVRVR
jgi:DNA-binding transcriptional LysR family regulator